MSRQPAPGNGKARQAVEQARAGEAGVSAEATADGMSWHLLRTGRTGMFWITLPRAQCMRPHILAGT